MATASKTATGPVANIKVMSPAPQLTTPLNFALPLDSTILQLKEKITRSLDSKPDPSQQRLIYRGKFLRDEQNIGGILGASANGEDPETSDSYTFHLALRPSATTPFNAPISTLTPTTIPATTSSSTVAPSPAAQPHVDPARLNALERQRQSIQEAIGNVRQRLDRINDLTTLATSASRAASAPAVVTSVETRVDYAPGGDGSGGARVTRTTHMRASVRLTSRSAGRSLMNGVQSTPTSPIRGVLSPASPASPILSNISTFNTPSSNDLNTIISNLQSSTQPAPPMYLLQGPEGQCILLAGPPSSVSPPSTSSRASSENHPVIQRVGINGYLPGESPTDTFASSDTTIPGLEGITQESLAHLLDPMRYGVSSGRHGGGNGGRRAGGNEALGVREMLWRERARLQGLRDGLQRHHQQQQANAAPALNQIHQHQQRVHREVRQFNIADVLRRLQDGGTHVWLAIRLVVFVMLFSGGAGWRRRITLGALAFVIFIWQTGILNNQFAAARALYRELFPPHPQQQQQQRQQPQPQPQPQPQHQPQVQQPQQAPSPIPVANGTTPLDPAATAQLLVQRDNFRRQTRIREAYESVERVVGLFVTSLVPGMGERQVREHEERERLRMGAAGGEAQPGEQAGGRAEEAAVAGDGAGDGQAEQAQRGMEDAVGGLFMGGL